MVRLTQAAELADDGGECVVHHTLQLAVDAIGELPAAEVARLDVPLDQWHGDASRPRTTVGHTRTHINSLLFFFIMFLTDLQILKH